MSVKMEWQPATYEEVVAAATKVAELDRRLFTFGFTNVAGLKREDLIKLDAEGLILRDLLARAEAEYRSILSRYTPTVTDPTAKPPPPVTRTA